MYLAEFESLRQFAGSNLGKSPIDLSIESITSTSQINPLIEKITKLCNESYREIELNAFGLSRKTQISYFEDIMYVFDNELRASNICVHSSRWETWLSFHLNKLQGKEPVKSEINSLHATIATKGHFTDDSYHISSLEGICNRLAVREYIEYIGLMYNDGDKSIVIGGHENNEHLDFFDIEFIREYTKTLADNQIFILREGIHKKYAFKGGKRIKRWLKWYEEESNYNSSDGDTISIIHQARNLANSFSEPPPLTWAGSGTELLDLFVALNEKGYIKLPLPGESGGMSLERIAKAICGLFDISNTRRKDSKSAQWVTIYQYLKETSQNRVTKQYTHDRLKEGKRNFECISPPKPRSKSSK